MSHIRICFNWTDVDIHHLETARSLEFSRVSVVLQGPLRAAVRAEVKYGQSTINLTVRAFMLMCIYLSNDSDFKDFSGCHGW